MHEVWTDAGMNYLTDFADILHLNINGATKTTSYMGEYLLEHDFGLSEAVKVSEPDETWNEDLKRYQEYLVPKKEQLEENIRFWEAVHANDEQ